ncbi:TetR/AcrR family transcriptional regulator MbcR [soil metagenome]
MTKTTDTKPSPRQRLLDAADELFYREGVHTVGIDRVIEKAGVARGSLYYNFTGGKDELVREYLHGRHAAWSARVDAAVDGADTPTQKILVVFDVLGELFSEPDYRGCSFMNALAEAPADGPEVAAAANFRAWVHETFEVLVARLDVADEAELADQLVVLYDGAVTAAQMDSAPRAAATAKKLATMAIAMATVSA